MDRDQKYDMFADVLKKADEMGFFEKIEPIAFDVGYVALAYDWPYDQAIEWALNNIEEEKVKDYTFYKLNKKAKKVADDAYREVTAKEIKCYKCGKSDKIADHSSFVESGYQHFSVSFGYGSKHDEESWSWTLCEDCLVDIIATFKYVPKGFFLDPIYDEQLFFDKDRHQAIFEKWKETSKWMTKLIDDV